MNRKLKLSLICFLFIVLASHSFAEVDLSHLVKKIHPAVVTVITYDKNKKPLGQGSGFFIDSTGHLITNYHVLEGAYLAVAKTYDGKSYPINSVIGENKKMDLIKVLVDIPRSSVQWINATGALPSIAERVVVIGSPMGLELTVSEGIVSSVREMPDLGKTLQISAAISPGSSGGPVVNMKGQVIGIVSFYLIKGQNLNFAIPAKYLLDLKSSKTIKTISEWTYGVDKKSLRETSRQGRFFVHTEPKGARIRILNIKPKFYQGIELDPGRYNIEVSQGGYKTVKIWETLGDGENKSIKIKLSRLQAGQFSDTSGAFETKDLRYAKSLFARGKKTKASKIVSEVLNNSKDDTAVAEAMYCQILWELVSDERDIVERLKVYYPDFKWLAKAEELVAEHEKLYAERFVLYSSGVVLDKKLNLEWYAGPNKDTYGAEAMSWIESLNVAGGGWRMPTEKELMKLHKNGVGTRNMTPLLKTTGWFVWSVKPKVQIWGWPAKPYTFRDGSSSGAYGGAWESKDYAPEYRVFAVRSRK